MPPVGVIAGAGSLLNSATGGGKLPLPSITGGAAAPSSATTGPIGGNTIFNTSGGGMLLPALALIIAVYIWKRKK